jgi:calmodulin
LSIDYKEAFALYDKKGTGSVARETLGDLLRSLGQNPTQAEVADSVAKVPPTGMCASVNLSRPGENRPDIWIFLVDYNTFFTVLNRPDGWKPAGTPGKLASSGIFLCVLICFPFR